MTKSYFFRLIALVMLPLLAFWLALKWTMFFLGVLAMPDDAVLALDLLRWLATTPWWVPGALMLIWLLFLAYAIWPSNQMKDEIGKAYSGRFEIQMRRVENKIDLASGVLGICQAYLHYTTYSELMAGKEYDLSNQSSFDEWAHDSRELLKGSNASGMWRSLGSLPYMQTIILKHEGGVNVFTPPEIKGDAEKERTYLSLMSETVKRGEYLSHAIKGFRNGHLED